MALVLAGLALWACGESEDAETTPARGQPATATAESARCEHGLPPALCPRCNPALEAVYRSRGDWCAEHGLPESFCPECNPNAPVPDVSAAPAPVADWCVGHGLPESMCTRCNPSLVERFRAAGDYCEEHGFPESACPICNPQQAPSDAEQATLEARVVRLRSPDLERSAGIETVPAERGLAAPAVACTARLSFDADRVADVRAVVPGVVRRLHAELGARVEPGEPLFDLESTRIGEIQGALQDAHQRVRAAEANAARQRDLRADDIASARQVEVAEQELASARADALTAETVLRMAGAARSAPSGRYTLRSPIAGEVVRRPAILGVLATDGESLATIADTSVLWALCDVPEALASRVAVGQRIHVEVDGLDGGPIEGEITWLSAEVDPRTRTVTARAVVPNPDGQLRANQFARARIDTAPTTAGVTVPRSAVQRAGSSEVVFVRTAEGVYEPRVVERRGDGDRVQVEGRVRPGDAVVTTGAVLLRTEILPGSIGAGCCEVEVRGSD